jgi:hypothetical protein
MAGFQPYKVVGGRGTAQAIVKPYSSKATLVAKHNIVVFFLPFFCTFAKITNHSGEKMATTSEKKEMAKRYKSMQRELLELMLKKADLKKSELYDVAERLWVSEHLDMLTAHEREKFKSIIL